MHHDLIVPQDTAFLANLVLQRTGPFIELGGANVLNDWFLRGDITNMLNLLNDGELRAEYINRVTEGAQRDAEELANRLSGGSSEAIVSIGPGNGIVELYLLRHLKYSKLLLIDIESTIQHHHGWNSQGAGYANLRTTQLFLELNGIDKNRLYICNPKVEKLPDYRFDSLVSLLSMGFHYPCDEYVNFIFSNATENATVILDKRLGVKDVGYDKLLTKFELTERVDYQKSFRGTFIRVKS
jgi:hypothetical protein